MINLTTITKAIFVASIYLSSTSASQFPIMSSATPLQFTLSQTTKSPPTLLITLKNTHPTTTFTILKWGTPLDASALNTGVFQLTDAETHTNVPIDVLMINRKMPPGEESLLEIKPGEECEKEVVFDKPWMPSKKPAKYVVKAEGEIEGVWEKAAKDITEEELYAYFDSAYGGLRFDCEEMLVVE
jgi:hypothetical protein